MRQAQTFKRLPRYRRTTALPVTTCQRILADLVFGKLNTTWLGVDGMKNSLASDHRGIIMLGLLTISACSLPSDQAMLKSKGNVVNNHARDPLTAQSTLPPPRDPQLAVQEEFDGAKQKGTIAAWQLFLARHPDNIMAAPARRELNRLILSSTKLKEKS